MIFIVYGSYIEPSKWVVGQQNVYDYFDISWGLPFQTGIAAFLLNKMTFEEKSMDTLQNFLLKKIFK